MSNPPGTASSAAESATGSTDRRIVLVVGPGRSGTSTMAGVLTKLGLEVPGRMIAANETNPRGFFEPRWVVNLHKSVLRRSHVSTIDADPSSGALVDQVIEERDVTGTLTTWLAKRLESQPRLVVKDPRLIWFTRVWATVSKDLGITPDFVVMLRHPAEVVGSRQTYYARGETPPGRADNVAQLAGWVNVALQTELETRSGRRLFVYYPGLTADWRAVAQRIEAAFSLGIAVPDTDTRHEVDDFIDPSLRRVQKGWSEFEGPEFLRDLADRLWQLLGEIAEHGDSDERLARADALREEYALLALDAAAMSRRLLKRARVAGAAKGRAAARRRVALAQAQQSAQRASEAAATASVGDRARRAAGRLVRAVRER